MSSDTLDGENPAPKPAGRVSNAVHYIIAADSNIIKYPESQASMTNNG